MFAFRNTLKKVPVQRVVRRRMGGGGHGEHAHGHHAHEPHVPHFYNQLGRACLITTYLWFFYRLKQDNGQLFGFYKPWLHEHEHAHFHFIEGSAETVPTLEEHDEDEDEDEEH